MLDIIDDGTLDTVVGYKGKEYRFDSAYRFSFDDDTDFLNAIKEEIEELHEWTQDMESKCPPSKELQELEIEVKEHYLNTFEYRVNPCI